MAKLSKPTLTIKLLPNEKVDVHVTGNITFVPVDLADMQGGSRFTLSCSLFGDDPQGGVADGGDDNLEVSFKKQIFTGAVDRLVRYTFNKVIQKADLNEDGLLDDEVYAKVRLVNDRTPPANLVESSNVIAGEFAERRVG
jgi:hypothetical protein